MNMNDNPIQSVVRRRIRLSILGIVVAVACTGFFVLYPEYSHASRAMMEIDRLERESGSIDLTESRLDALEAERDHRLLIEKEQLRSIPDEASEAHLSDALALKVDDGGATSWSIRELPAENLSRDSDEAGLRSLPFVVEMQGRYGFLLEALNRVESSDRLIRVRMLRIKRSRSSDDLVEADFEIDTVYHAGAIQ